MNYVPHKTIEKYRFKSFISDLEGYYGKKYHQGQIDAIWGLLEKYSENFVVEFFSIAKNKFDKLPFANDLRIAIRNASQYEMPKGDLPSLDEIGFMNCDNRSFKRQMRLLGVKSLPDAVQKVKAMNPKERAAWLDLANKLVAMLYGPEDEEPIN
jgi:hypothetical protein